MKDFVSIMTNNEPIEARKLIAKEIRTLPDELLAKLMTVSVHKVRNGTDKTVVGVTYHVSLDIPHSREFFDADIGE